MPAVLFDAVGTLLWPEPAVADVYTHVARRFGSRHNVETIAKLFAHALARQEEVDLRRGDRTSEAREVERWRQIVAEVLDDVAESDAAFELLWEHFAEPRHWQLADEAAPLWQRLSQQGFTLGLASNFDQRLHRLVRELDPVAATAHVFVSSRLGVRKPNPQFFRAIETALQLSPDEIILVGDDLHNDYQAARAAGWHAVLFDPSGTSGVEWQISRFGELPAVIERLLGSVLRSSR